MNRISIILLLLLLNVGSLPAQFDDSSLKIFGYFQNLFSYETSYDIGVEARPTRTSFNLQQLNVFFQKDIAARWRAFINFEFVNNFSSSRHWGSVDLEEAWIRYRANARFNLKLGIQVPVFNHLNEIKNKTPLLPYAIRPLAYETSFRNFIEVDEFVPKSAFIQAYGFFGLNATKLDYAVYAGNSPNINGDGEFGQTGVDTSTSALLGGRIGIRHDELKLGVSFSRDVFSGFPNPGFRARLPKDIANKKIPRYRFGTDLSFYINRFSFESELIGVFYDHGFDYIHFNKSFYYGTAGYRFRENLFAFFSYWSLWEDYTTVETIPERIYVKTDNDTKVPSIGVAFNINERITLKAQAARVFIDSNVKQFDVKFDIEFNYYALAASVYF